MRSRNTKTKAFLLSCYDAAIENNHTNIRIRMQLERSLFMKKIIALVLTLAALFSLAIPANAAIGTYYSYTDKSTGNVLTVPSSWEIEYGTNSITKVEFTTSQDGVFLMTYGSSDIYAGLDAETQRACPRKSINNDMFDKEDIADVLGVKASEVTMTTVGGHEYFLARSTYNTTYQNYNISVDAHYWIRIHNGWMYMYQYLGDVTGNVYNMFVNIVISYATYGEKTTSSSASSQSATYNEAVNAYNAGKYATALSLFQKVPNYASSQDYMRLIRIRTYGDNIGIGCVYDYRKALTDAQKADIDAAARNFYFADTAEVLMCNTDVATYYLFGSWVTANNAPQYAYLKWHKDSAGGYYYTRSTNLSNAVSDCVSINDGYVRVSITSSNTLVFHIKLTGPNSMSLYCYEYGKCVELYRQ